MSGGASAGGGGGVGPKYTQIQTESSLPAMMSSFFSIHLQSPESARIFDELPKATIVQVSRPDAADISPVMLTYTIEFEYKQVYSFTLSLKFNKNNFFFFSL